MPPDRRRRNLPHLVWTTSPSAAQFVPVGRPAGTPPRPHPPARGRAHGQDLADTLRQIREQWQEEQRAVVIRDAERALYIVVEAVDGFSPPVDRLTQATGAEVVACPPGERPEYVTWRVPEAQISTFIRKFEEYATRERPNGAPYHPDLVEYIASLRRATVRALWTAAPDWYPDTDAVVWWELWLRSSPGRPELRRLREYAAQVGADVGEDVLVFGDRSVVLVRASARQLSDSIDVLGDLAELRPATPAPLVLGEMPPSQQMPHASAIRDRVQPPGGEAPAVCILDTGVTREHVLIEPALDVADHRAARHAWRPDDHDGHGTEMAGVALYGDLRAVAADTGPIQLRHRIESCKILPPPPSHTEPRLWGRVTNDAVVEIESHAPPRRRAFAMAVTVKDEQRDPVLGHLLNVPSTNRGVPTSWSGAMDALASGLPIAPDGPALGVDRERAREPRRLVCVSAGNNESADAAYVAQCDVWPVEEPAHAWNVLTVGAHTELDTLAAAERSTGLEVPLAQKGDLSPYTTTSVLFREGWPIKPEVLFEGGNKLRHSPTAAQAFPSPSLSLTTTHFRPHEAQFCETRATSPATMLAAKMAAEILAERPAMWPETVRALIVHSARWTPAMQSRQPRTANKAQWLAFHRQNGYGVPDLSRALRSAANAVTLVREGDLHPFRIEGARDVKYDQWHEHVLPWPVPVLQSLGAQQLRLRVTLSYFIDPHPVRAEGEKAERYASCGLRFELKRPEETAQEFHARMNRDLRSEVGDRRPPPSPVGWLLGGDGRHKGSLHQDIWTGSASALAAMDRVVVYPVHGWWRHGSSFARIAEGVRYALVTTIETVDELATADLYAAVETQLGVQARTTVQV